jgi:hypothetical protein
MEIREGIISPGERKNEKRGLSHEIRGTAPFFAHGLRAVRLASQRGDLHRFQACSYRRQVMAHIEAR